MRFQIIDGLDGILENKKIDEIDDNLDDELDRYDDEKNLEVVDESKIIPNIKGKKNIPDVKRIKLYSAEKL